MALIEVTSSISQINPSEILTDGFELSTQTIIPTEDYSGSFTTGLNNVEFYIYNASNEVQYSDYDFTNYSITDNTNPNFTASSPQLNPDPNEYTTNILNVNPEQDIYNAGFTNGKLTAIYNFVNHELSSSITNPYYLSEISSDRTEIRLKSNYISNTEMQSSFISFDTTLKSADFFDEFYISFGNNENHIGVNTQIELPTGEINGVPEQYSILIKLYDALPPQYQVGEELYVVTKTGETKAFQVEFVENINVIDGITKIQGPNTNLKISDFVNNSTTYKNKDELLKTNSSSSKDELINVLSQKGIHLTPNYSSASFSEFVNFSSAQSRINNFYTKVQNIQSYENDIRLISSTTASNSIPVSSSLASLWTKIEDEIKNFDGYEYYQYYNTSSDAYPKTGSSYPYELLDSTDVEVLTWLGSNDPNNQYFGGMNFSASFYDENNENWLYYTIPSFITEQNNNDNYVDFSNMVGQSFVTNYWDVGYSWEGYVEQLITDGWPYPIDRVSKEIFKRLYHNMSYLVKKKGTVAGLRQLINIWGVPNTILRINEFGGKDIVMPTLP